MAKGFQGFACVVCNINKRSKKSRIKQFKLCGVCYNAIRGINNGNARALNSIYEEEVNCPICGDKVIHWSKYNLCGKSACRGKFYRDKRNLERINRFISNGDLKIIDGIKYKKIDELGFKIIIQKKTLEKVMTHK